MAGITPSVGLITGVPIQDTINKLMQLSARPRETLLQRNSVAQKEQAAIGKLQSLILSLQVSSQQLAKAATFDKRKATSTDPKLIEAVVTDAPAAGTYSFTPVREAQSQQLLGNGFASNTQPLGAGSFSFRFGGFVNEGTSLDILNGGNGVRPGKIHITDRSGAATEIDLRFAQTVNDVLEAINTQTAVRVLATADGDRLRLTDKSGSTLSNLRVQEVGTGKTAADLGLAEINVAANQATGQDVVRLFGSINVDRLNQGNGLRIRDALADLQVNFRNGSAALQIDFRKEQTLGQLLQTINSADPARLRAELSADGDRLQLIDLTTGVGTFTVSSPFGGSLAQDLGLSGPAVGGVITGSRLLGGLKTALLKNLNGGSGYGALGNIAVTNRAGIATVINLSSAETLDGVIGAINNAGSGVEASYNSARNGIQITDRTGSTARNLVIANSDATNSADKLQIAANTASGFVNGGSLDLQVVSENTKLDALNGGKGIFRNTIVISDSSGAAGSLRLLDSQFQTLGNLIDGINNLGIGVQARINDAGDGIVLVNTANGAGVLNVRDVGSGRAAHELGIRGNGFVQNVGGSSVLAIKGSSKYTVTLGANDNLQDFVSKINTLNAGVVANLLNIGGSANPYRVTLVSQRSGKAGELMLDVGSTPLVFTETAKAQDALLSVGASASSAGILVSSNSNEFTNVVNGLRLTIKKPSSETVTVTVENSSAEALESAKKFVTDFNKLDSELDDHTSFNEINGATGLLFGSTEALRIESGFAGLLSSRIFGAGSITSLEEVGLTLDQQGRLSLNEQKFKDKFNSNVATLKDFFVHEKTGAAVRINNLIDQLAGTPKVDGKPRGKSLLDARTEALQARIDANTIRIDQMSLRLQAQRELLEKQFASMEVAISKLQRNLSEISKIQNLAYSPGGGR